MRSSIKAMKFAIESHEKVNHRYDGVPYSLHLSLVAIAALSHIHCLTEKDEETAISSCWLHDVIEDCRISYNDLLKEFPKEVADVVYAVSNEKGRNRSERANEKYYDGIRENDIAIFVKLCDRLANIQYSHQLTEKKMIDVYRKENNHFIESILIGTKVESQYSDLVESIETILNTY